MSGSEGKKEEEQREPGENSIPCFGLHDLPESLPDYLVWLEFEYLLARATEHYRVNRDGSSLRDFLELLPQVANVRFLPGAKFIFLLLKFLLLLLKRLPPFNTSLKISFSFKICYQ